MIVSPAFPLLEFLGSVRLLRGEIQEERGGQQAVQRGGEQTLPGRERC